MFPRLRDRIEEIIAERLPIALLDRGIKQHQRHGFKTDCQCYWCNNKRIEIHYYMKYGPTMFNYFRNGE